MANLPDGSGDAYSNLVQGNRTASLTFVMPGTVPLSVESVVATVDNTAGADTTATLVIRDSSGQVIATKRQGSSIPAAGSGTATWALRLDDNGGGIQRVTSTDGTVAVTNPTGPTVDLAVTPSIPGTLLIAVAVTSGANTNIVSPTLVSIISSAQVTFTVPTSGKVLARLGFTFGNSANVNNYMGFVDGGGTAIGTKLFAGNTGANATSYDVQAYQDFVFSGLTPGASVTWFAAAATNGGTMIVRSLTGIGTNITIEIWSA